MRRKSKKEMKSKEADNRTDTDAENEFKKAVKGKSPVKSVEVMKTKKRKKYDDAPSDCGGSSRSKKKSVRKVSDTSCVDKKEKIMSGNDYVFKSRPSSIYSLMSSLNEEQQKAVKDIGFGGDKFVVTPDDICDVFLLPRNEGSHVEKGRNDPFIKSFLTDWNKKYSEKRLMIVSGVRSLLGDPCLDDGGDDFKRLFVIYVMSVFFAPTMNRTTHLNLIKSVIEVHRISSFDWCSYVLDKLCRAIVYFRKNLDTKHVIGCVLVLPLLYLHHLKWRGFIEPSTLPLIRHWNASKFNKRFLEETKAGGYGQGEFVNGVYPVSCNEGRAAGSSEGVHMDGKGSGPSVRYGTDAAGRYIRYFLPPNEKTDEKIHRVSQDGFEESFFLLKRDLNVITHAHMERLQDFVKCYKQRDPYQSSSSCVGGPLSDSDDYFSSDKFCCLVDEVVASFKAMQEHCKSSYPTFGVHAPHSPVGDVNDVVLEALIDDVCKNLSENATAVENEEVANKVEAATVGFEGARTDDDAGCVSDDGKKEFLQDDGDDVTFVDEVFKSVGPNGTQNLDIDPIDPWFVANDEWEVDEKVGFRGSFFLSFSVIQSLQDSSYIYINVIDVWALLLDQMEKHNAVIADRDQLKVYFTGQCSLFLGDLLRLCHKSECGKSDKEEMVNLVEAKRKGLRGSWSFSLQLMGSFNGAKTAELILVHFLDNLKRSSSSDSLFWKLASLLHAELADFLEEIGHPQGSELRSFALVNVDLEWQKTSSNFDCGVFVMNLMQNFEGKLYECNNLMKSCGRRKLRALYCVRILLSGTNHMRFQVHQSVLDFMNKKKK
ncbi:hypothetical protein C2S51_011621 [Perilla frutescens var. frutescens]|nr:hypothetical protein C2S51_011621 [Perilla frutescens var. frutescens]